MVIPEDELPTYQARGYALVEQVETAGSPEANVVPMFTDDDLSADLD